MNPLTSFTIRDVFNATKTYVITKASQWCGRLIHYLKLAVSYLADPRLASAAIFVVNFGILEIAFRASRLVAFLLPGRSVTAKRIKWAGLLPLTGGLIYAGNVAFIKVAKINLQPSVVLACVTATLIVKFALEEFIKM